MQSNLNRACFSPLLFSLEKKKKPIPLPSFPHLLRGKERWKAEPGSSEFSFYSPGTIYHPFLPLSLSRERERESFSLGAKKEKKNAGGKRRLAESIFARQCGSLIIYAKLSRSGREREMEDRGSYFLPVTSHYYAGRRQGLGEGREGNGVVGS